MSILKLPAYHLYWSKGMRYAPVAALMSCDRYKKIRSYLQGGLQKCLYFSLAITFTKIGKPSRFFSPVTGSL